MYFDLGIIPSLDFLSLFIFQGKQFSDSDIYKWNISIIDKGYTIIYGEFKYYSYYYRKSLWVSINIALPNAVNTRHDKIGAA